MQKLLWSITLQAKTKIPTYFLWPSLEKLIPSSKTYEDEAKTWECGPVQCLYCSLLLKYYST